MVFSDTQDMINMRGLGAARFDRWAFVDELECNAPRQDERTSALHVLLEQGGMDWAAGGG